MKKKAEKQKGTRNRKKKKRKKKVKDREKIYRKGKEVSERECVCVNEIEKAKKESEM
jgi:hypothetical protein